MRTVKPIAYGRTWTLLAVLVALASSMVLGVGGCKSGGGTSSGPVYPYEGKITIDGTNAPTIPGERRANP